jgi:hypothetical protein
MEFNNQAAESADIVILPPGLPDQEVLDRRANYVVRSVAAISITTPAMYISAADELQELQGKLDKMTEERMNITRPLDATKKAVMDLFRAPSERMETAIKSLKESMLDYKRIEAANAREEQRKADEAARLARVEANRLAIEAQAEVDKKNRELADARKRAVDAEQAAIQAAAAGDKGAEEEAAARATELQQETARIESEAEASRLAAMESSQALAVTMAPVVHGGATAVKGISTPRPWTAKLINDSDENKMLLVKFVVDNPQYINFIDINMKPVIQLAKSMQANFKAPGVFVYQDEKLTSRRK